MPLRLRPGQRPHWPARASALQHDSRNALSNLDGVERRLAESTGGVPQGGSIPMVRTTRPCPRAPSTRRRPGCRRKAPIIVAACVIVLLHVRSALMAIASSGTPTSGRGTRRREPRA